jgi:D-specific alpha-keto acid dehydrogenase
MATTSTDRSSDPRIRSLPPASLTKVTVFGCTPDEAVAFQDAAPDVHVRPAITSAHLSASTAELARGSRCVSVAHTPRVANTDLLALSRMGVTYLSTRSIGFDHIDVVYANRVGITVENVAYSPDSVADYTVMLMLMVLRGAKAMLCRGAVHDYRLPSERGRELRDLTVGVVGTGRIGAAVIDRLHGFGARVLAHDNRAKAPVEYVALDELLQGSDLVSLHTPLNSDTRHLLDHRRLALMRSGAFVVNTARGPLIETDALLDALESGRLGGAALDVVEAEEGIFYSDNRGRSIANGALRRLQEMPNVVISPHAAFYTDHALRDTVVNGLLNCVAFEKENHHD